MAELELTAESQHTSALSGVKDPHVNSEYDLSDKILCIFTFNCSSFRKDSILLGTTSVWAGLDLLGAKDAPLF